VGRPGRRLQKVLRRPSVDAEGAGGIGIWGVAMNCLAYWYPKR